MIEQLRDINCQLGCESASDCFVGKIREGLASAASSNEISLQQVLDGAAPANTELLEQAGLVAKVQDALSVCALESLSLE